jgi:hypothetical protein
LIKKSKGKNEYKNNIGIGQRPARGMAKSLLAITAKKIKNAQNFQFFLRAFQTFRLFFRFS